LTLFEYVAIAYCLVISFAVTRAASVLPYALAPDGRYWVHTTWVFSNLGFSLLIFWNFWSFREVAVDVGLALFATRDSHVSVCKRHDRCAR